MLACTKEADWRRNQLERHLACLRRQGNAFSLSEETKFHTRKEHTGTYKQQCKFRNVCPFGATDSFLQNNFLKGRLSFFFIFKTSSAMKST
jgi:hypothetical protein